MGKKVNYIGKDGGWYENYGDYIAANNKYEQQETQNKLLEQQNRNIEQQNILIEQQNKLNYQLEQEKIQKNYELEMNKLEHEEKMRILRLFDDIGISKETYDAYINAKFTNEITNELLKQRDEHLLMSSKYDFLLHEDEKLEEFGRSRLDEILRKNDMFSLRNSVRSNCYNKVSEADLKEREKLKARENKIASVLELEFVVGFISFVICSFLTTNGIIESAIIFWVLLIIVLVFLGMLFISKLNSIDKKLKLLPEEKLSEKKYKAKLNQLLDQEIESANKLTESIKSASVKHAEAIYKFRLNHYNASIEKLLVDVGFKDLVESLGLEYKKVNNSNKKKDGTIEDYVEFFETNS